MRFLLKAVIIYGNGFSTAKGVNIDALKLFDKINKANIPQRDRFILMFMLVGTVLLNSVTGLVLAKQLPDLVEWILKLLNIM